MKKFIALALSLVLAFGLLTGCGAEKTNTLKVAMSPGDQLFALKGEKVPERAPVRHRREKMRHH